MPDSGQVAGDILSVGSLGWSTGLASWPQFYEYFPKFVEHDLAARRRLGLTLAESTFLTPSNLERYRNLPDGQREILNFLRQAGQHQREAFGCALRRLGIRDRTVVAMAQVPREAFLPARYAPLAAINHWLNFDYYSCLSMPGLVALMIDRLGTEPGDVVLEAGIGSGYHAACVSASVGHKCSIFGLELNPSYAAAGRSYVSRLNLGNISIMEGDAHVCWPGSDQFDRIYITAANWGGPPQALVSRLRSGGTLQFIRGLTESEFRAAPADSWPKQKYGSYEEYGEGEWTRYCCLVTANLLPDGTVNETDHLYNVRFTPLRRSGADFPEFAQTDLDWLLEVLDIRQ